MTRIRNVIESSWRWIALDGDRRTVTVVVLLAGFLAVGPAGHLLAANVAPTDVDRHVIVPLVAALLSGTFFLFSIVVSVNSLFVSGQQNPLGQQFGRIQSIVQFRRQLEDVVGVDHVPARPEPLLRLLSGEILERAQRLQEDLVTADFDLREDLEAYVASLAKETGEMNRRLAEAETTFDVLRATMDYNHDRQINDLRELQSEYGDSLSQGTADRIEEMLRLLQYFATAREYFKTLYTRREFADLSRDLVLTAVPAVAVVASFMHFFNALPNDHLLVSFVEGLALAPFLLVASYVLRVATVSKRTQAAGEFVHGDQVGDIEGITREE